MTPNPDFQGTPLFDVE